MTEVRFLVDVANVAAGDVVERPQATAEWLAARGIVEILETVQEPPKRRPGRPKKTTDS